MDPAAPPDTPSDDALLLRCFVREGSQAAFRALAERHLPLVWSVARRVVNGDAALDRLRPDDRDAIVLRYYEKRPLREVGRALGTSEEAARKRIDRALVKLRLHLQRRGTVPALAILAALLRDESVAAPSAAVA